MFERFTNKARHVVVLAQEEARKLRHSYIGTEHILLGLLGESEGHAFRALERFGMSLESARDEVSAIVGTGQVAASGHIPFTPRAKKTLELALREALQLHHNYIGTEHILLGVIREGEGVGAQVLRQHADLEEIRIAVLDLLPAAPAGLGGGRYQPERGRAPGRVAAGRIAPSAASRAVRSRYRRGPGPRHPRRGPGPGPGGAPPRGRHRHQRRAARGGRPPPDGDPRDR